MSLGPAEIIVVLLVALVVLGPDKLPQAARTLSKYLAEFRKFSSAVQSQVDDVLKVPDGKPAEAEPATPAAPSEAKPDDVVAPKPDNPDTSGFALIDERKQTEQLAKDPPPADPLPTDGPS